MFDTGIPITLALLILIPLLTAVAIMLIVLRRRKKRRERMAPWLDKIPLEILEKLSQMLKAYKNNDTNKINDLAASIDDAQLEELIFLIGPRNRPNDLPGGKYHDTSSWTKMENSLQRRGLTVNASKIMTGIILHYLKPALMEISKRYN